MRELLYHAADHFKRGQELAADGDPAAAANAYADALRDLHAVKPHRMRNVLLAQVYLSRATIEASVDPSRAAADFRMGYAYARTTGEPHVRELAERMRSERLPAR
jgi:hypothetical protein